MATFENSERLYEILGGFFRYLAEDATMAPKLLESKLIVRFDYTEPQASITVDLSGSSIIVSHNDDSKRAEVVMRMKADVAHRFWLGQVNLMIALARREIVAKGPIPKILRLLPVIKPAHALYQVYWAGLKL